MSQDFNEIVNKSPPNVKQTLVSLQLFLKDFKKSGFNACIVTQPGENGSYWGDYASDEIIDRYGYEWFDKKYMLACVYLDESGKSINTTQDIIITYQDLTVSDKKLVITLLDKYLENLYEWSGKNTDTIKITYEKSKSKKIDLDLLKENDVYPLLRINIDIDKELNLLTSNTKLYLDIFNSIKKIFKKLNVSIHSRYGTNNIKIEINSLDFYNKYQKKLDDLLQSYINKNIIVKYQIEYTYSNIR